MSALREALEALAEKWREVSTTHLADHADYCDPSEDCAGCRGEDLLRVLAAHDDLPSLSSTDASVESSDGGSSNNDDPPAPVGVDRVEWGVRHCEGFLGGAADEADARWVVTSTQGTTAVRRTVTSYPDTVGEWVEVAGDE